MKIVLDTNVLVSGLLSPVGPPAEIVRMIAAGIIQLCYDSRIITEYINVLKRPKFELDQEKINILLNQIEYYGYLLVAEPINITLPDEGDKPFLEVAIASEVNYLVTGNIKHYPIEVQKYLKIISPYEFLLEYRRSKII